MAQEAHASPGPRRAPTGRRTCPARHFQGLARGWTAGTGPCRLPSGTDMAGGDGLGSRRHRPPGGLSGRPYLPPVLRPGPPRLPPVPGERGPLGNLRPLPGPLQPQASTGPAPQRSAADLGQAGRVLGSCATQGRSRGRQQPGPGHPGATARPPAEASPAQAWPCLPQPFRGPPAPPDAPHGPPRSRLTRRREVSQPSSPLATQPARPVQAPAAVLASRCRAPERHRSFRPRRSPAPCPGMSAAHRRAWGWAGLGWAGTGGLIRQQHHVKA